MDRKEYSVTLNFADLIDKMSILKIKEYILSGNNYDKTMKDIEHDLDVVIEEEGIECSAELMRKIVVISICNIMVWFLKDKMQEVIDCEDKYMSYLEEAQDLNNCIKNSVKNMILEEVGMMTVANKKTTFLEHRGEQWFSPIVEKDDNKL